MKEQGWRTRRAISMGGKTQVGYQRCEKTEGSLGHSGLLSLVCRETGQVLPVLPENVALEGGVAPAFQLPLAGLQDDTRIVLQLLGEVHVRASAGESRKTYCGSCS